MADATTTYTGTGGVQIGGFTNRLQLASYFGDFTFLISEYIQSDSRVLLHRDIHEAVQLVAPFLTYDADPYIVIADGKLYWIQDAYTTSSRYPNSTPYTQGDSSINYIRNSVKVVIDAYTGTMDYYVVDNADPVDRYVPAHLPDAVQGRQHHAGIIAESLALSGATVQHPRPSNTVCST